MKYSGRVEKEQHQPISVVAYALMSRNHLSKQTRKELSPKRLTYWEVWRQISPTVYKLASPTIPMEIAVSPLYAYSFS